MYLLKLKLILLRGAWDEIRKWDYIDAEGQGIYPGIRGEEP